MPRAIVPKSLSIACFVVAIIIIIIIIIIIQAASRYPPRPAAAIHFLVVSFFQTQPLVAVSAHPTIICPMCARYPCS